MPRRNRLRTKRQQRKTTPDTITIRTPHIHTIARAGFTNYCTTCGDVTTTTGSN